MLLAIMIFTPMAIDITYPNVDSISIPTRRGSMESAQRILMLLAHSPRLTLRQMSIETKLTEGEVSRAILFLKKNEPPLINELGHTGRFQISRDAAKQLNVSPPPDIVPTVVSSVSKPFEVAPGAKALLIKALRHGNTIFELARYSGLSIARTRYFLKRLADKGLVKTGKSVDDGRVLVHRLTTEPPKPILTPSLVPLTDEGDWRTWMERLVIQDCGGPVVVCEEEETEHFGHPTEKSTIYKPRILIVGRYDTNLLQRLHQEFDERWKLHFFDARQNRESKLQGLARYCDYVFIRADVTSHSTTDTVKTTINQMKDKPLFYVTGGVNKVCSTMKECLPA